MCAPSRVAHNARNAATRICRCVPAPLVKAAIAPAMPVLARPNVQMVSTQPELPVLCCTSHATAMTPDSANDIRTIAVMSAEAVNLASHAYELLNETAEEAQ